jgi:hypothetical protein
MHKILVHTCTCLDLDKDLEIMLTIIEEISQGNL